MCTWYITSPDAFARRLILGSSERTPLTRQNSGDGTVPRREADLQQRRGGTITPSGRPMTCGDPLPSSRSVRWVSHTARCSGWSVRRWQPRLSAVGGGRFHHRRGDGEEVGGLERGVWARHRETAASTARRGLRSGETFGPPEHAHVARHGGTHVGAQVGRQQAGETVGVDVLRIDELGELPRQLAHRLARRRRRPRSGSCWRAGWRHAHRCMRPRRRRRARRVAAIEIGAHATTHVVRGRRDRDDHAPSMPAARDAVIDGKRS